MKILLGLAFVAAAALLLLSPVGGDLSEGHPVIRANALDLSAYADTPPAEPIDLVFLHHSVGAHLLATPGPEQGTGGIVNSHPNGGGLNALLADANYRLHEATYGSALGEDTDLFDWLPKFRERMDDILAVDQQDRRLPDGVRNRVVMFKSCFPNNEFVGEGSADGSPSGPDLTEANARATMKALRSEFEKRPDVLFVYLTAPPVAPRTWTEARWKVWVKHALGRPSHGEEKRASAAIARRFNNWVADPEGWLQGYPHRNVVVFEFYDALTDRGASNFSRYATGEGFDSHPSAEGLGRIAPELVRFLNRAVKRADLVPAGLAP